MTAHLTRTQLAGYLDHTLLRPEATRADIVALAADANRLGTAAACVQPTRVGLLTAQLRGPVACAVVGFPSGTHDPRVLALETELAVDAGAHEIDMVLNVGALRDGAVDVVADQIAAVRKAADDSALVKVIVESAALTEPELILACRLVVDGGAAFIKTSTGFHPAGGATTTAVALMAELVHPHGVRVKASGGIRTTEQALAMIAAGTDRIGCSASEAILDGLPA